MESVIIRNFRNRIGKAIRRLRTEENIGAEYIAKVLGVNQSTISRIENGSCSISAEKLFFLAKSYNRPLSFFVGEKNAISYDEEDILRAGLAFYGASSLKTKRTIDIDRYYHTYADFLKDALTEVDDARFASALATTLYKHAVNDTIKPVRILATVQHEQLVINLVSLIDVILNARTHIKRPSKEIRNAFLKLSQLKGSLESNCKLGSFKSTLANIEPAYVAEFINESLNA